MRCRVAQVWAGKEWGGIYIPRVGMEVVVQFLEGDPDQPLVIGTVYNNNNMPPYGLPGEKTIAGVKSKTRRRRRRLQRVRLRRRNRSGEDPAPARGKGPRNGGRERRNPRGQVERKTEIGDNDTLNVKSTLKIDAGMMVKISAGAMIELTCGGSKITMLPALTTITVGGSTITLTPASVSIQSLAVDVSAPAIKMTSVVHDITGAAAVSIKAPIVNINKMVGCLESEGTAAANMCAEASIQHGAAICSRRFRLRVEDMTARPSDRGLRSNS